MKRLIFTLAIVFGVVTGVSAQSPGKVWVGGSVGINSSKVKGGESATSYKIIPELGYVVSDNWGIGIKLGYNHDEEAISISDGSGNLISGKTKSEGFEVNPFVRYAFIKGDIGGLFIDGGVGYKYAKDKTRDIKTNTYEVGFRPGVSLNVSDKVALTGKFGFLGYEHEKEGDKKTDTFGFNLNMENIQLGVNFVF